MLVRSRQSAQWARRAAAPGAHPSVRAISAASAASAASRTIGSLVGHAHVRVPRPVGIAPSASYVSRSVLRLLDETAVGRIAIQSFAIQRRGDCFENSSVMLTAIEAHLIKAGHARALLREPEFSCRPSAQRCMEMTRGGPALAKFLLSLPHDQGGSEYDLCHAFILLDCFVDRQGNIIGIVIDGNDLQRNPAMAEMRARAVGWNKPVHRFDHAHRAAINRELAREGKPVDVHQAAFRFVNLDAMTARSNESYNADLQRTVVPELRAGSIELCAPLFDAAKLDEFRDRIDSVELVPESFEPAPRPVRNPLDRD